MVQLDIKYLGQLRCETTHEPSGQKILTDAPKDNMGQGAAISPTDSVGMALGACMITTMGIVAQRDGISMEGATARVVKEMTSSPPRRIAKLSVEIHVPGELSEEHQQKLRNAALHCPVHKSLHPDVDLPVTIRFGA